MKHLFDFRAALSDFIGVLKEVAEAIWCGLFPPEQDPARFATTPPPGWHGATPKEAPDESGFVQAGGGTLMWDGQFTHYPPTPKTGIEGRGITPAEWGEMQEYKVSKTQKGLNNVELAAQVKRYWLEGKSVAEIAVLVGFDKSTVRQYAICLQRAKDNRGNAFQVELPTV